MILAQTYMWLSQGLSGKLVWQGLECTGPEAKNCGMVPLDGLVTFPDIKFSCLAPSTPCEGTWRLFFQVVNDGGKEVDLQSSAIQLSWLPNELALSTAPAGCTGGLLCSTQPAISVRDSSGILLSSQDSGDVLAAIAAAPTGNSAATLKGTTRVKIKAGLAVFTDLSIDLSHDDAYIVQFTSSLLNLAVNASFAVATGPPHSLIITSQPGNVQPGQEFTVSIIVRDVGQNQWKTPLGQDEPVMQAQLDRQDSSLGSPILSGPSCAGSSGICRQQMVSNVATFNGLRVDKAPAVYRLRLTASPAGVDLEVYSDFFSVLVGSLAELRLTRGPVDVLNGTTMLPISLRLHDGGGNFLSESNGMQIGVSVERGSGVLNGTTSVTVAGGKAVFDAVNVTLVSTSVPTHIHVLKFSAGVAGVVTLLSNPFTVTFAGAKARLATFPPRSALVGEPFLAQPEIACVDLNGNLVASSQAIFTASASVLGGSPSAFLSGMTSSQSTGGVARFTDLALTGVSMGYTLAFSTSCGSSSTVSWNMTLLPGPPATLQIVEGYQPGAVGHGVAAGDVLPRQPRVQLQDAGSNVISTDGANVKCCLISHQDRATSQQLVLGGSPDIETAAGVAIFTNLAINLRGVYSLAFWFNSHYIESKNFTIISGPISQIVYDSAPSSAVFDQDFQEQPRILLMDMGGNRVLGTPWVHMRVLQTTRPSLIADPSHKSVLTGCSSGFNGACDIVGICKGYAQPDSGVVEFTGCRISQPIPRAAEKHRLIVSTVESFDGDPPIHPLDDEVGDVIEDSTKWLESAEFGVSSAEDALRIRTQLPELNVPTCESSLFAAQPSLGMVDTTGALVPSFLGSVHVQLMPSPLQSDLAQPRLTGNLEATFAGGVAQFTDLGFAGIGQGLALRFVANGSTSLLARNFTIDHGPVSFAAGSPHVLVVENVSPFVVAGARPSQPTTPRLRAEDCQGNQASLCLQDISVSLSGVACDHDPSGVSCMSVGEAGACINASNSSRPLSNYRVFKSGTWTLTFTVTSSVWGHIQTSVGPIQVTSGSIEYISIVSQPTDVMMDESMQPPPALAANDAFDNRIIGCSGAGVTDMQIVAHLNSRLIDGALKGSTASTVDCLSGLAHFTQLAVDTPGFEFTITFSVGTDIHVESSPFAVSGPPVELKLLAESRVALDSDWIGGVANTNRIHALIIDAGGNPSFVQNGTISVDINDFGFTLSGNLQSTADKGIAVFENLVADKIGAPRLRFTYPLPDQTLVFLSSPLQVVAGPAHQLGIELQPGWSKNEGGTAFPWQPLLQVQDAGGNPVEHVTPVTASIARAATPGAATSGTTIQTTQASGRVLYTDLAIDLAGVGYRLGFSAHGLGNAVSEPLDVSPGPPARLAVIEQPDIAYSGLSYPFLVHVQDAGGNFAVGNCSSIQVSLSLYPVQRNLYMLTDFVLTPNVAAINGIAHYPSIMMPIALPYTQLSFTCMQQGIAWSPALSKQFSVGPSQAIANCPASVPVSATSCGPPQLRGTNLVLESSPQSARVGLLRGPDEAYPIVQARDNDGIPIRVPAHKVYARLATPSAPVVPEKLQGLVVVSNSTESVAFSSIHTEVSGAMRLTFVAGFDAGLRLQSATVNIDIGGSAPSTLVFLEPLARRIILGSTASTKIQLKDDYDNVADAVVAACVVGTSKPIMQKLVPCELPCTRLLLSILVRNAAK